jgi:signal transduction histidine kinase
MHHEALHREREKRLRADLVQRFSGFEEHARFVARQDPARLAGYLTDFKGLARAVVYDRSGAPVHHVERFDYLVAEMPAARLEGRLRDWPAGDEVRVSGLETDRTRRDLHPDLRTVVRYSARRGDGGVVVLTVYATPFLGNAQLLTAEGHPLLDSGQSVAGEGWRVAAPASVDLAEIVPYLALALGVLVLGGFAYWMLERQARARDRITLERGLAQGERLRSLGVLASGIAHEINNPLEGIANWLAVGDTTRAREGLDRIAGLTTDLLRFARGEDDAVPFEPANVRAAFTRASDLASVSRVCKGVRIEESLPDELRVRVPGAVLEQVFLNLLLNAAAATDGQAERIVRVTASDAFAIVEDNGPGLSEADMSRIFDPFFSRTGGTGLGLSVSYGMLAAAGGRLRAENVEGKRGARFIVEMPLA